MLTAVKLSLTNGPTTERRDPGCFRLATDLPLGFAAKTFLEDRFLAVGAGPLVADACACVRSAVEGFVARVVAQQRHAALHLLRRFSASAGLVCTCGTGWTRSGVTQ